jgi:glycopeptide antibiotics resistance protein
MYSILEVAIMSLSFVLPMGWLIATKYKMWHYCFAGYWIVTALLVLLITRVSELIEPTQWVLFHLVSLNGIVFFVLGYGLVRIYMARNRKQRNSDKEIR